MKKRTGRTISETDRIVANSIGHLRISAGLSQKKVADHLGVTFQQVQKYERGVNRLPVHMLHKLKILYNVPYEYFFGDLKEVWEPCAAVLPDPGCEAATFSILRQIKKIEDKALKRKIGKIIAILAS